MTAFGGVDFELKASKDDGRIESQSLYRGPGLPQNALTSQALFCHFCFSVNDFFSL
jgi:hypothetical protein